MNRLLPVLLVFVLCSCSQSKEDKAKALIKDELRITMHDFKSYEPVKFGKLDSSFTSLEDDSAYVKYVSQFADYKKMAEQAKERAESYIGYRFLAGRGQYYVRLMKEAADTLVLLSKKIGQINKSFTPKFNGWVIEHSYRAKNLSGNLGIHHYNYYLDSTITKVIKTEDISESASKIKD